MSSSGLPDASILPQCYIEMTSVARAGLRRDRSTWQDGWVKLLVAAMASELSAFPEELEGFDQLVTGEGKMQAVFALSRRHRP